MTRALAKGDVIEVMRFVLNGALVREEWRPAQIIFLDEDRLGVRFVKAPEELLMLARRARGRAWR